MVKVFYADISSLFSKNRNVKVKSAVRQRYINSIKDEKRRTQSLAVWKLLEEACANLGYYNVNFAVDRKGKWFETRNKLKFSISHSGNYIVVAVDKKFGIGVDVEKCSARILKIGSKLSGEELNVGIKEKMEILTRKWTERESLFKSEIVDGNYTSVFLYDKNKNEYVLTVYAKGTIDFIRVGLKK